MTPEQQNRYNQEIQEWLNRKAQAESEWYLKRDREERERANRINDLEQEDEKGIQD